MVASLADFFALFFQRRSLFTEYLFLSFVAAMCLYVLSPSDTMQLLTTSNFIGPWYQELRTAPISVAGTV